MAAATPLDPFIAGLPAQLQTWEAFEQEAKALHEQGLRGAELVRALGGGEEGGEIVLRTSEDLDAFLGPACASST